MKVLLLSPPFKTDYMRNARCDFVSLSHTQWYPILLGSAGALLEKAGHEVAFWDAPSQGMTMAQVEARARRLRPDVLVIYGGRLSEQSDQRLADRLTAQLGCRTVFCGPYVSIAPERWLEQTDRVEGAISGEFEYPLVELVEGKPVGDISNLHYKDGEAVCRNAQRPYLERQQLDAIPWVSEFFSRHLDINNYRAISEPFPFMDMMTGHGCCWGVCTYCLWVHSYVKGPVYNTRSLDNIIGEVDYIRRKMPRVKSLMFQDDTLAEDHVRAISEAILARGWKLKWSCYARANLSYETLQLMQRAGCLNLHVGFESSDPRVLKNSKKGLSTRRMTCFVSDAKRAGLHIHGDFLMGLEGETRESLLATARWAKSLDVDSAQFQVLIPFEGTPLYDSLTAKGQLKDGYPDYPDLPAEEIHRISKMAYRSFYLRPKQIISVLAHPRSRLWHYLKVAHKIIPSLFGSAAR